MVFIGFFMMVAGGALWFRINSRKFNRRNQAGLEEFTSYGQSVGVGFLERLGKLVALVLIVGGFFVGLSGARTVIATSPAAKPRSSAR